MHKPASLPRLIEILDAYGSDLNQWPEEEREQLELLLADSRHAQQLLAAAAKLDLLLDQYTVPEINAEVQSHILEAIPFKNPGLTEKFLDWLFPVDLEFFWRPALAVTLPLLIGFVLGSATLETVESTDSWEEDIYLVGIQETGNMAL